MYLNEEDLEVHPFLGKNFQLREMCIKSLDGSIAEELINFHGVNCGILQG
jgi:hypothetical protein